MPEPFSLGDLSGERLSLSEYLADFGELEWAIGGQASWKLERGQHFREPGLESWEAFTRGEWERSVQLMEEDRNFLAEYMAKASGLGIGLYRVRVVEEPVDPYLQWELLFLKLRAECGEHIRVITSDLVRDWEVGGPLPELLTMGPTRLSCAVRRQWSLGGCRQDHGCAGRGTGRRGHPALL